MSEPLKIDIYTLEELRKMNQLDGNKQLCFVSQVNDRAEWLKEEHKKMFTRGLPRNQKELDLMIDKAFEEVMK